MKLLKVKIMGLKKRKTNNNFEYNGEFFYFFFFSRFVYTLKKWRFLRRIITLLPFCVQWHMDKHTLKPSTYETFSDFALFAHRVKRIFFRSQQT
jgi:hypothetical protein